MGDAAVHPVEQGIRKPGSSSSQKLPRASRLLHQKENGPDAFQNRALQQQNDFIRLRIKTILPEPILTLRRLHGHHLQTGVKPLNQSPNKATA